MRSLPMPLRYFSDVPPEKAASDQVIWDGAMMMAYTPSQRLFVIIRVTTLGISAC